MRLLQTVDIRCGQWSEIGEELRSQFFIQDLTSKIPLLGGHNTFKTKMDVAYVGADYDSNGFCTERKLSKMIDDTLVTLSYNLRAGTLSFTWNDALDCIYNMDASKTTGWLGMWLHK